MDNELDNKSEKSQGILDTVSISQQSAILRNFNPQSAILEYLSQLEPREKQVIMSRYGLDTGISLTLETIGEKLSLTRERIRQIEKDAMKKLNRMNMPANFVQGVDIIFQMIEDHGNILRESQILEAVLNVNDTETARAGILFVLNLVPKFNLLKDSTAYHQSWYLDGFDKSLLDSLALWVKSDFENKRTPAETEELIAKAKEHSGIAELASLSQEAFDSYLAVSKYLDRNPFGQWGLASWPDIRPKDVGDKAYLVLTHHGKPEHYSKITELINKQKFDERTANKESVHNELIKDARFVLIGRGIYALKSWGYQKGVVADIIEEILRKAGTPLAREQIIERVMKQRMVKKNTIIVGLSNKQKFQKTQDNKYVNVQ